MTVPTRQTKPAQPTQQTQPTGWPAQASSAPTIAAGHAPVGWQAPVTVVDTTRIPGRPALHEVGESNVVDSVTLSSPNRSSVRMAGAYDVSRAAFDIAATALFAEGTQQPRPTTQFTEQPTQKADPMNPDLPAAQLTDDATVSRETAESVIPTARHMRAADIDGASIRQRSQLAAGPAPTVASHSARLPAPAQTRVLTIANQKGGVGKTTTTVNLAAALAQAGLTVLVIDMDPQGNASTALGVDHRAEVPSIYDVLIDERPLSDVVAESPDVPGLWCAPATIDLAGAEIELVSLVARESRLQRAVAALRRDGGRHFDYILIDCPPSLGLLTVNAFVAAQEVFIPIQCEYYALEGLSQLLKNVELIKKHLNADLKVGSILMTMYDARTRLSAQVADEVRNHFPDQVLKTRIPRSVRISEAPSFGQTVMSYDPGSSGALSYREAATELAKRS